MVSTVKELQVYNRAYKAALDMHKISITLPQIEQFALASQIRRASKGICANLAEGFAKSHASDAEFRRYALIAAGSSQEMGVWLDFCKDLGYIDAEAANELTKEYEEITKMLKGLVRNWKDNDR